MITTGELVSSLDGMFNGVRGPFGIRSYRAEFTTLYCDEGIAFCSGYPSSPWPRTEEDIRRQEMDEAWAEVNEIAPGWSDSPSQPPKNPL